MKEEEIGQVIVSEFQKVDMNLENVKIPELINHQEMINQDQLKIMRVLDHMIIPSLNCNYSMLQLVLATMVNISLKYGVTEETPYSLGWYAGLVGSTFNRFLFAYELGKLAVDLIEKHRYIGFQGRTNFIFGTSINLFQNSVRTSVAISKFAFQKDIETGDLVQAGYAGVHTQQQLLISGTHLDEITKDVEQRLPFLGKNIYMRYMSKGVDAFAQNLRGNTVDKYSFSFDDFNEDEMLAFYGTFFSDYGKSWYYTEKLQMYFLYDEYVLALETANNGIGTLGVVFNTIVVPECLFYHSLTLCALFNTVEGDAKEQYQKLINDNQERMKIWADNCEANFLHKYLLVEAELCRIQGKSTQAVELYDQAISSAHQYEFTQNEALASELFAKFWLKQDKKKYAQLHMRDAVYLYDKWGATMKVRDLKEKYPELLTMQTYHEQESADTTISATLTSTALTTTGGSASALDIGSVMKASQAIAGEIKLERLLDTMLRIIIENAGAQKGLLVLPEEKTGNLIIQAEGEVDNPELTVLQAIPLEESEHLSAGIVQYVSRSMENLVLNNACNTGSFQQDNYIKEKRPKSVLCSPVINQGKLVGIIYMENNLTTGAFTQDRLEVLQMLSSQAAVSLENALLYQTLEQKVEERTEQLRQKTNDINNMLQNLEEGVFTILEDGSIHQEYSKHLENIFETPDIAGNNFMELLFSESSLGVDDRAQVEFVVSSSIAGYAIMFDGNRHVLPSEYKITFPKENKSKTLEIDWNPIVDHQEMVEKILVAVRDVTELRSLQAKALEQQRELEIIGQVLDISEEKFSNFSASSREFLKENQELVRKTSQKDIEVLNSLYRNIHTIKGNARTFGFVHLTQTVHEVEHHYDQLRKTDMNWDQEQLLRDLGNIEALLEEYIDINVKKLGRGKELDTNLITIGMDDLDNFVMNLDSVVSADPNSMKNTIKNVQEKLQLLSKRKLISDYVKVGSKKMEEIIEGMDIGNISDPQLISNVLNESKQKLSLLGTLSLEEIISGITTSLPSIAEETGKAIPILSIQDNHILLKKDISGVIKNVCIHLYRNALDHGIEIPDIRQQKGKKNEGNIYFEMKLVEDHLDFIFGDDGQGLNLERIREKAIEDELISDDAQLSQNDLAQLIFTSGVSTAEKTTDISGRGVGMDAVKKFIEKEGGIFNIRLLEKNEERMKDFQPIEFHFTLPARYAVL